jgi:hypothetical protein
MYEVLEFRYEQLSIKNLFRNEEVFLFYYPCFLLLKGIDCFKHQEVAPFQKNATSDE